VQIGSSYRTAADAWEIISRQWKPDLIVAVMPRGQLSALAKLAAPVPVVIALMDYASGEAIWTGKWLRVIKTQLVTEPEPNGA
jgi:hypothetical protein